MATVATTVTPEALARRELGDASIVDVRSPLEFRRGHVHGSRNVPLHQLAGGLPDEVDAPTVLVSLKGMRAHAAAEILRRRGTDADVLRGGIRSWLHAGLPTDKGDVEVDRRSPAPAAGLPGVADAPDAEAYRGVLEATMGVPFNDGNRVEIFRNGDEIFPAMLAAIDAARTSIDFLTFVYWTGDIAETFAQRLAARAADGVRVRVLLDAMGANEMDPDLITEMRRAGATVEKFHAVTWRLWNADNRTHRKILVCDGEVGFTGGVGIAAEWTGDARDPSEWRDTHLRFEGPAVQGLQGAFLTNWIENDHPVIARGDVYRAPDHPGDVPVQVIASAARRTTSDVDLLLRGLLRCAHRRLRICTAYFAPDRRYTRLLGDAVDRGVQVQLLVPGPHIDKRVSQLAAQRHFPALLDCGVEIWRYQPTMLHAKVITVDGAVACIGSPNVNTRSMRKDDEVACVVLDADVVHHLDDHFDHDLTRAERLTPERWQERSTLARAGERVVRLIHRET
jgi:cardiolipin synthase